MEPSLHSVRMPSTWVLKGEGGTALAVAEPVPLPAPLPRTPGVEPSPAPYMILRVPRPQLPTLRPGNTAALSASVSVKLTLPVARILASIWASKSSQGSALLALLAKVMAAMKASVVKGLGMSISSAVVRGARGWRVAPQGLLGTKLEC